MFDKDINPILKTLNGKPIKGNKIEDTRKGIQIRTALEKIFSYRELCIIEESLKHMRDKL